MSLTQFWGKYLTNFEYKLRINQSNIWQFGAVNF